MSGVGITQILPNSSQCTDSTTTIVSARYLLQKHFSFPNLFKNTIVPYRLSDFKVPLFGKLPRWIRTLHSQTLTKTTTTQRKRQELCPINGSVLHAGRQSLPRRLKERKQMTLDHHPVHKNQRLNRQVLDAGNEKSRN